MRGAVLALVLAGGLAAGYPSVAAQTGAASRQVFKLGTFERAGRVFLGLVLRDTQVVDIAEANVALERRDSALRKLPRAGDMNELIVRYETELKERLCAIASDVAASQSAPQYVYAVRGAQTGRPAP